MNKFIFVVALVVALFALAACAAPATPAPAAPQAPAATVAPTKSAQPKTLVVCMAQEPESLYRHGTNMAVATYAGQAGIFDGAEGGIDTLDFDYQPVIFTKLPKLEDGDAKLTKVKVKAGDSIVDAAGNVAKADKEMELDQITATFKLKPGLKWSDGNPLTAKDFVFTFNTLKDKDSGITSRFTLDRTASYVAKDDSTLEWTGLPGFTYALYYQVSWTPIPEHVLKGVAPKDIKSNPFARKPVGFGPFRVTSWVSGDRIEMEKNPNYWRASEGLPKLDKVIYRFIPDTNQLTAQLIAGQCDIGTSDGLLIDSAPFLDQAEKSGLLKPSYTLGTTWEHIDFNTNGPGAPKPRPDFFGDVRVRQAIAYGTNRKEMVDKIVFGKSKVMDSSAPANHWAYPKDDSVLTKYPFDAKKAEALLDEAGWVKGADGIRAKAGQRFSVTIATTAGNKPREQIMQVFQANMKAIGIEAKLDFPPSTVLFGRGKDSDYLSGNNDLMLFAWVAGPEPTVNVYRCPEIPTKDNAWSGQNNTFWCNKDFDTAVQSFNNTLEKAKRIPFAVEAQKILTKELPILPLYQRITVNAASNRVLNFKTNPSQSDLFNIEEIDVKVSGQ